MHRYWFLQLNCLYKWVLWRVWYELLNKNVLGKRKFHSNPSTHFLYRFKTTLTSDPFSPPFLCPGVLNRPKTSPRECRFLVTPTPQRHGNGWTVPPPTLPRLLGLLFKVVVYAPRDPLTQSHTQFRVRWVLVLLLPQKVSYPHSVRSRSSVRYAVTL